MTETAQPDPALHAVRALLDGTRASTVEIDGLDVTDYVLGVHISADAREAPRVVLELRGLPNRPAIFDGMATVEIARDKDGAADNPGPVVAEWLSKIDAVELERVALMRGDLGRGKGAGTQACLNQLIDWAAGA